ncbi:MAG: 4Fe-4S binding protein, partial [Candidatus Nezhaarchaeales archaeon]
MKVAQPSILVVGGGIAGMEAALGASALGAKVCLVESGPSLGGRVAQLHSLYPQLTSAMDLLKPRMRAVVEDPNIEVLTCAEPASATRSGRGFEVRLIKRARHVDPSKCDLCGKCAEVCPAEAPDEFNLNLSRRKAIYLPFKEAVPRAYVLDEGSCAYFRDRSCRACAEACPRGAVDLEEGAREVELRADAVILAVGYDPLDLTLKRELSFGASPDVVSGLQLERMLSLDGPTRGEVVMPSRGERPKSVAVVLCAGSRDQTALAYCCRVGCMAGLKHAYELKRKYGDAMDVYLCFNDIRAAGKGYEEFYREARRGGVVMMRGLPSEIRVREGGG